MGQRKDERHQHRRSQPVPQAGSAQRLEPHVSPPRCQERHEMSRAVYSRRDFAKVALAGLPAARALAAINSKFKGVQVGAITYSFRSLPAEEVIPAMVKLGLGEAELMSSHGEALAGAPQAPQFFGRGGPQGRGGGRGGRGPLTPEQQEAMRTAQEELRKWRLSTSPETFKAVRKKFSDA